MVPGLAVSDEEIIIEESQDKLTLYWAGRIAFVKPSQAPISVIVDSSLTPTGKWQPLPSSRFRLISAYQKGVNSHIPKIASGLHELACDSHRKDDPIRACGSFGKRSGNQRQDCPQRNNAEVWGKTGS